MTKSALKINTIANYIGQFYTIVIAIVMMPLYLKLLGAEAYGLVGFFALVQSWMVLLDMGLSATLTREVAKALSTKTELVNFKKLLHSLELILIFFSLVVTGCFVIFSNWLSENWLNVIDLDVTVVSYCISLMGLTVGLRLLASLYRSGISGAEKQVWLNIANIIIVTLKFVGVVFVFYFVSNEVKYFFEYQIIVAIFELAVLSFKFYKIMDIGKFKFYFSMDAIRPVLPFMLGVAYTSGIWVVLTQLDKLILSGILPLKEFGYLSLIGMVANAVLQLMMPLGQALQPRMVSLLHQHKEMEMLRLYKKTTQLMAVSIFSVTGVIAVFSYQLLYSWSGNLELSVWGSDVLFWYVLGNAVLTITGFQYALQFAHGQIKMHVWYNTVIVIVSVPLIFWSAFTYGALGVAQAWFVLRMVGFLIWVPIVHHKFAPGIHMEWLLKDVAPNVLATFIFLFIVNSININFDHSRAVVFSMLLGIGVCLLIVNCMVSNDARKMVFHYMRSKK